MSAYKQNKCHLLYEWTRRRVCVYKSSSMFQIGRNLCGPIRSRHFIKSSVVIVRPCATQLLDRLEDTKVFDHLTKTREDVASFVRFNRNIDRLDFEHYSSLFSPEANPEKNQHELKEIELKVKLICAEFEYMSIVSGRVPTSLSFEEMERFVNMDLTHKRQLLMTNIYSRDMIKVKDKVRTKIKQKLKPAPAPWERLGCFDANGELAYGLFKTCLFYRMPRSPRRLQNVLNARLRGPTLALDWHFESEDADRTPHPIQIKHLVKLISGMQNTHCKMSVPFTSVIFNLMHFNLDHASIIYPALIQEVSKSPFDLKFFQSTPQSYLDVCPDKQKFYISPYCSKTLHLDEISSIPLSELMFIFSPYTELNGLPKRVLERLIIKKEQQESSSNVQFRRLPLYDMIRSDAFVVLSQYVNCLHDVVIANRSWTEALQRNISVKKHLHRQI